VGRKVTKSTRHEGPSAAEPQPKDSFHHEGTKVTKEDFSRKGAKDAKKKTIPNFAFLVSWRDEKNQGLCIGKFARAARFELFERLERFERFEPTVYGP
jgi:hypothetical protein